MTAPETLGGEAEPPAIEIRGLRSQFGSRVIHEDLDLTVERGEILGVVGGSGSGKSVMLNTIIGLKRPEAGSVHVFGHDIHADPGRNWGSIERRWGVLFQQGALFSNLTVAENVEAPLAEHTRMSRKAIRELAEIRIGLVGLPPEACDLKPSELSGGMRKRAGLDPIGAAAFDDLILELSLSLGLTVFMITHDLDSLYAITTRVAVLADKHVVAVAPVQTLETSTHPWIQEYFLGPRGRAASQKFRTQA